MQASSPNNSYLETCVRLWSLGDFYSLPDLCERALSPLYKRCKSQFDESRSVNATINEISFLPDLEAGIRAAWSTDRISGVVRRPLMTVCTGLAPVIRDKKSFMNLLREIPKFSGDFLDAILGCDGLQIGHQDATQTVCSKCGLAVLTSEQGEGKKFIDGAFVWTPRSVHIHSGHRRFYCSETCYKADPSIH